MAASIASPTLKTSAAAAIAKTWTAFKAKADMQAVLDQLGAMEGNLFERLKPEQSRRQFSLAGDATKVLKKLGGETTPSAAVTGISNPDREITGAANKLSTRIYTPDGACPSPVIGYSHGGGWVIADKQVHDGGARGPAKQARSVVTPIDDCLAPARKFPATWNEAFAAYKWLAANAASAKDNPRRLAPAGDSAGGKLALATATAARYGGVQAPLQVLAVYPVGQTGNLQTKSYQDSAPATPFNNAMIVWFVDRLLAKPANKADPRLDLVNVKLAGLPPVTIINAQIDPLREDGALLDAALEKAGVEMTRTIYNGVAHELLGMAAAVKKAAEAPAQDGKTLLNALRSKAGAKL